MGTKGTTYRYGNTRGSNGTGKPTEHINYQYAKDFNKHKLSEDFEKHKNDFGVTTEKDYATHAVHFANTIDRKNCVSFVDAVGKTHKYNISTNTYISVDKNGYIVTYFRPTTGNAYYYKQKRERKK